jgi:hypothetical protein
MIFIMAGEEAAKRFQVVSTDLRHTGVPKKIFVDRPPLLFRVLRPLQGFQVYVNGGDEHLSTWQTFLTGSLAKVFASVATYPTQVGGHLVACACKKIRNTVLQTIAKKKLTRKNAIRSDALSSVTAMQPRRWRALDNPKEVNDKTPCNAA